MRATYIPLSILVHTRNEGGNIAACLEGLRDWAAEVLVFDMQSTDDTVERARPLCHQVVSIPFQEEFDAARNISGAAASQPWVLMLDADERLTPTVKATIEELIALDDFEVGAYQLPFRTISFGTWIQHAGGWWPSYKSPPLLRKGRFHFPGHVHGPAMVDGKVVRVTPKNEDDAILHYSHPDLTHYFEKLNRYTSLEGKRRGGNSNWEEVAKGFGQTFAWYFDQTEGYRDGLAGFLLAFSSGIYEAVAQLKQMEATQEQGIPPSAEAFLKVAMESARAQRPIPKEPHPAYGIASIVPEMRPCELQGRASLWSTEFQPLGLDWPGKRTEPELRVAMITHANALNILGGGEVQLFETVRALEPTGVSGSVGIGTVPPDGEIAHLFSLHHGAYTKELAGQPYVLSPIYWDRAELAWIAPKILALAEHSETLAQLESGIAALNRQDQSLRDEGAFTSTLPEPVKALVRGAAMLLPNAKAEAAMLEASMGEALQPVRVIPNGSPRPTSAEPGSSFEGLESGSFALCVGRIEINKNQLALILACRQLDVPLVLIGSEPDPWYASLCRRVAGLRTKFMGSQPRGVALKAMRQAAVHVLPSFAETPGLANLEAISVGCPLICSTRGAEREYFGDAAQYVEPLDLHAIADAIRFAMNGPKHQANWSPVTWQDVGLATSQVYRVVLDSRE